MKQPCMLDYFCKCFIRNNYTQVLVDKQLADQPNIRKNEALIFVQKSD